MTLPLAVAFPSLGLKLCVFGAPPFVPAFSVALGRIELCFRRDATSLLPIPRGPTGPLAIGDFWVQAPLKFELLFALGFLLLVVSVAGVPLLVLSSMDPSRLEAYLTL